MKRRDFLKMTQLAGMAYMINGLPISTYASNPLLELLGKQTQTNGRVLVLIQLNGGNDGLNTVIPLDKYSELSNARSNILIPQNNVLSLANTTTTGLHPSMTGIQDMYNNSLVNIVQGAGYPDQNFSHFRSTDIWLTASDSSQYLNSGWLGRYLEEEYAGFPQGYPNSNMPDPLAIQVGSTTSLALQGSNMNMGMAINNIDSFYNIVNGTVTPAPNTPAGHELTFIRHVAQQTQTYTNVIAKAAQSATNQSTLYPTGDRFAEQLKIVARLIAGGLQTPIYIVNLGGFDTHSLQTDSTDTTIGKHADLLKSLSDSVAAFFDDCKILDIEQRVAAMTFSEFGRRIKSNASGGTDHGSAAPIMVFSHHVNPGIIGTSPNLPNNASVFDNLTMQHDFREVYAAVLADWFQVDTKTMDDILLKNFKVQPVFKKVNNIEETTLSGSNETLDQNYPNPFSKQTTIRFGSDGGATTIQLFDAGGRKVKTILQRQMERGQHQITINRDGLPAGNYFYRIVNGKNSSTKKMVIID